jgi:hypothetical protein
MQIISPVLRVLAIASTIKGAHWFSFLAITIGINGTPISGTVDYGGSGGVSKML